MSENVTQEFSSELDEQWQNWLTKRFIQYCIFSLSAIFIAGLGIVLFDLWSRVEEGKVTRATLAFGLSNLPIVAILIAAIFVVKKRKPERPKLLRAITWTVAIYGFFGIIVSPLLEWYFSPEAGKPFFSAYQTYITVISILSIHLLACLFIPWPPKEAVKAFIPLWVIASVFVLLEKPDWTGERIVWLSLVTAAGVPGLLICFGRAKKYQSEFYISRLSGRYSDLKRELQAARQIQDLLFPDQITEGPIQARYHFEPMQQIGGDFIYIRRKTDEEDNLISITATLIDVTGHGITAALAVTQLQGELDRLYAEEPNASPARVIRSLNKYINLTIARRGVYTTGISIKLTVSDNKLIWSNAGHPAAYVLHNREHDRITPLATTCMMLGVLNDNAYSANENELQIADDDRIIAYTDGIIEARNKSNEMLRNEGLERILTTAPLDLDCDILEVISNELKEFRPGQPDDDVLMVELKKQSS
ncbi:SpoIIE family protein phosphatase [Planctomycetota bacterium]|nr:SpoIIE family protein phosphatase [Planctomycetota bacterium]